MWSISGCCKAIFMFLVNVPCFSLQNLQIIVWPGNGSIFCCFFNWLLIFSYSYARSSWIISGCYNTHKLYYRQVPMLQQIAIYSELLKRKLVDGCRGEVGRPAAAVVEFASHDEWLQEANTAVCDHSYITSQEGAGSGASLEVNKGFVWPCLCSYRILTIWFIKLTI